MKRPETYLDWNATAPLRPEAAAAVAAALQHCGNPSSVHRWGRAGRRIVEDAREAVAALVGAAAPEVVFTSGGTEANNIALRGSGRARILVSAVEHASVLEAAPEAEAIPVDGNGIVRLDALDALLAADPRPALVSVMLANNETGVIEPAGRIAELAHRHGALFHCDAVQAAGKVPLDCRALGVDLLTLSAHKLGGPSGIGALVAAPDCGLEPLIRGGGQERGRRAGSENLPGIAGFGAVARAAAELAVWDRVRALRDGLEAALLAIAPDAVAFAAAAPRLPNTAAIAMPGRPAETQVIALDLDGVMVSAGAACSSGKVRPSHVLEAMGAGPDLARSTIRVSLGWSTTKAEIARFLESWTALYRRPRNLEGMRAA
ncbi:MAG TPA: cysteine desulfurase family protein [Stellaceae bacterium]|nr:cysteine desulfurase family protein [Stellaceae bacterium]